MKKLLLPLFALFALMAMSPIASAEWRYGDEIRWHENTDWRPVLREKIRVVRTRIANGIRKGELTRGEAERAYEGLDRIYMELDRMKSDGYLSVREGQRINHDIDELQRRVYRLRTNDNYRY